ncbi:MAG: DUF3014 domain-containing protein, partial [Gammaproteobacteria bacterium]
MKRYEQVKDKKSGGAVILVAFILITSASIAWFYFKYQQNSSESESNTQIMALPSASRETGIIDPLSVSALIDGRTATELNSEAEADNIVEIQQDTSFVLPDLEHSDALLREEMAAISPALSEWLNTD